MPVFRKVQACGKLVVGLVFASCLVALLRLQTHTVYVNEWQMVKFTEPTLVSYTTSTDPYKNITLPRLKTTAVISISTSTENATADKLTEDVSLATTWVELHQQVPSQEEEILQVLHNLDVCLTTTNLTHFFIQNDLLSKARNNAKHFITKLRQNIPTTFNSNYSSACWNINLDVMHCDSSTKPACQQPGIRGHLGSETYVATKREIGGDLSRGLINSYPKGLSTPLVCMPRVFITGFPKCGTTYLFCLIESLYGDQIYSLYKEPYLWVPRAAFRAHETPYDPRELFFYLLNYVPTTKSELQYRISVPMDASPNLFFRWRHYSKDEGIINYCLAPATMPQILPNSKFIVIMREPVDMLYSTFWFSCSDLGIKLSEKQKLEMPNEFHDKVTKKINILKNCVKISPIDKCMVDVSKALYGSCGSVRFDKAFYHIHIRKWLALFPREQFLFLATEDLKLHREKVERKILDFVNVNFHSANTPKSFKRGNSFCSNVQTRYNYHNDRRLWMRDDTKKLLTAFFKPYNRELATLVEDDRFLWEE